MMPGGGGAGRTMLPEAALRDLTHADARVRAQAADALGRVEPSFAPRAVEALTTACEDPHPSVRYAALLSLGELGLAEGAAPLVQHLADDEPLCREAATIALGQLGAGGGELAWRALVDALDADQPEVRFQAVASLAEIDAAQAAPLVLACLDDADPQVRAQALAALGDAGDRGAVDRIAAHLEDEPAVRHEAALALARLGDERGRPLLLTALGDRDRAFEAATALATLGLGDDPAHRDEVAQLATRRLFGDPLVKVRLAEALARSGDQRGFTQLHKAARARREDVRGLAQSVLSDLDHA